MRHGGGNVASRRGLPSMTCQPLMRPSPAYRVGSGRYPDQEADRVATRSSSCVWPSRTSRCSARVPCASIVLTGTPSLAPSARLPDARAPSRRCPRSVSRRPIGPGATSGPKQRIGTCSRVWSVPRQVGVVAVVGGDDARGRRGAAPARISGTRRVERLERGRVAGTSRRWPYSVSKSTRLAKTKPPSGRLAEGVDARRRGRRRCRAA